MLFALRFAWIVCFACLAIAQKSHAADPQVTQKMLTDAAAKGQRMKSSIVGQNVTAAAVLIPQPDVQRIFGKEIANRYAVIEINLGNKSPDAALIIHGVFVDYSGWALSGALGRSPVSVDGLQQETASQFQASTKPGQIASEEYRVVRGQLLDAQMWTARNWTIRLLTLAGSLASGYSFAFEEKGIAKGIAAFSGVFVPGLDKAWPDGTVEQLNRISDFGYQTNKIVPKEAAQIIVCFFPIDRFLSKGFRDLFLKSPALFFAPFQMLLDKKIQGDVRKAFGKDLGGQVSIDKLREAMPCYLRLTQGAAASGATLPEAVQKSMEQASDNACLARFGFSPDGKLGTTAEQHEAFRSFLELDYINQMSLNSVHILIDGVMTIDTTSLMAKVDSIKLDAASATCTDITPCFWADLSVSSGVRTGSVSGSYMTGGTVSIAEANTLGITEVKTITDGSSDQLLHFSFKLTKAIPSGTKLHFTVTKAPPPGQDDKTAKPNTSQQFEYDIKYDLAAPAISSVKQDKGALTIAGTGFYDVPPDNALAVQLHLPSGTEVVVKPASSTPAAISLNLPSDVKESGCWNVVVSVGKMASAQTDKTQFAVAPSPGITSAKRDGSKIIVIGKDLIDTSSCGGPALSFQLIKQGTTILIDANKNRKFDSATQVTLDLPDSAKDGAWSLHLSMGGNDVTGSPITLQ